MRAATAASRARAVGRRIRERERPAWGKLAAPVPRYARPVPGLRDVASLPASLASAGVHAARRIVGGPEAKLARAAGSSIATPAAAGWVTGFLNAAYYARPRERRAVDDLRLAFCVLTTRWHRSGGRRLGARDVLAFNSAFGALRFLDARESGWGQLDRDQLLEGAARLLGDWFPDAYADPARRGWGIAFPTEAVRDRHRPEDRLAHAALGRLTPPTAPPERQQWKVYEPVPLASAERAVAVMGAPERWPDVGSALGRFTSLRAGGLEGQTFEIEVAAAPLRVERAPIFTRAYVTATAVHVDGGPGADGLAAYVAELNAAVAAHGGGMPPPVPDGARPHLALHLTTHHGHFMGAAVSRILVYEDAGGAFLRDAGSWDPMPPLLAEAYRRVGHQAQEAFWGRDPEASMLAQIAQAAE